MKLELTHVLWALHAQLEKQLVAPFAQNYTELVGAARARVRASFGVTEGS